MHASRPAPAGSAGNALRGVELLPNGACHPCGIEWLPLSNARISFS